MKQLPNKRRKMFPQKKKISAFLTLTLVIGVSFFLYWTSQPFSKTSENEIIQWSNGTLTKDEWVKYQKQPYLEGTAQEPTKTRYWIVNATNTNVTIVQTKTVEQQGVTSTIILKLYCYDETDWRIFPFTINIPKAKASLSAMENATVLGEKRGWDTLYFKFMKKKDNVTTIEEWWLDEETRVAKKIIIYRDKPEFTTKAVFKPIRSSFTIHDETRSRLRYLGFLAIFFGSLLHLSFRTCYSL